MLKLAPRELAELAVAISRPLAPDATGPLLSVSSAVTCAVPVFSEVRAVARSAPAGAVQPVVVSDLSAQ